ncbi:MAG TPA: hypothetical protein VGL65_04625 [Gemmatimonadales bacterium]|jgi:hypothetical protein
MSIQVRPIRRWLLVAGLFLSACTSTTLVNMWTDPDAPSQPLNNVLVVTLRKNSTARRLWEDGFVKSLRDHGVSATPSYALFPDAAPDTAALMGAVRQKGFDAVLVAHELSASTETRYVPGYLSAEPVTFVSPWTGHYYTYFSRAYAPGYVEADRVVRYESELWETGENGRVVWSGTTESINLSSTAQVNHEIADIIVPALVRSGVTHAH